MEQTFKYSKGANWSVRADQWRWCRDTFADNDWRYDHNMGAFFFREEKDCTWFTMRWS